jgi:membrane fusion protein (multidrug efflux system)
MIGFDELRKVARKRRTDLIIGLILALITFLAVALMIKYLLYTDPTKARLARLPLPVQTLPAEVSLLHELIGASGAIAQSDTVALTTRVVSKVLKVPVDLGTVVNRGDTLVELDDRIFQSGLESAKLNRDHASKQLQRMVTLEEKGFGSAVETEKARSEDAAASEAVIRAEIDLANTRITSPTAAIVLERTVNPGETTAIGNQAFKLGVIEPVMMVAQVSEEKIGSVHFGMQAEVSTDAFPGVAFKGEVVKIDGRVNDATRTFGVYIKIPNSDLRLKPGITGYARLENQRMALAVPSTAVINPVGDRATVFTVDKENRAHLRVIRRGIMLGGMTELLDGIQEGEQIITVGQLELHDNDLVRLNQSAPWNK